ncbi:tripartite motif-containing protein 3-like [Patiria miniata]|uniref:Uncharacterized protein n=1 Tax=Patiria miniata TaxID=46514 RepID=A0A914BJM1_PATMI|nr:tripartite motif-containing protein 3-like [Patiria miniata]XP_038076016.1 tripartite motif-containing protein 3-like [Patiria miniata]
MAEWGTFCSRMKKFGQEHLQCSICHDWYKNPKILTCLHSFCKECLVRYKGAVCSNLKCPVCRRVTAIPLGFISYLPTDFKLKGMVRAVTKELDEGVPTCLEHVGKLCCGYCYTCNQVICFLCLKDSHNTHAVGEVGEVVESLKQFVIELTITNENSLDDVAQTLETVSKMEEDCCATLDEIRKSVEERADEEIARVTAAKQRILDRLDKIQSDREKLLTEATQQLNSAGEDLRKIIKDSEATVEISNDYNFLKKYIEQKDEFSACYSSPSIEHIEQLSVEFCPSASAPGKVDLGMLRGDTVIPSDDEDDDDEDETSYDDNYSSELYRNVKKWRGNWLCDEAQFPSLGSRYFYR